MLNKEIRRIRKSQNMTQVVFAERLGVSGPYIAQLETGAIKTISYKFAAKICEEFGLPLDHFQPFLAPGVNVPPPPAVETLQLPVVGAVSAGGGIDLVAEPGESITVLRSSMPHG